MSRLVIDVTGEQHQKIKAIAALQGQSIKDYILGKLIPDLEKADRSWQELEDFLIPRIEAAENSSHPTKSFEDITQEILKKGTHV